MVWWWLLIEMVLKVEMVGPILMIPKELVLGIKMIMKAGCELYAVDPGTLVDGLVACRVMA